MPSENFHVTLHFIGNVTSEEAKQLALAAADVHGRRFTIVLDHYGYFARPRVFWMGVRQNNRLLKLHGDLAGSLSRSGFRVENTPYRPHLSLVRHCRHNIECAETVPVVEWQVDDFVFVESIPTGHGVRYQVIDRYPLNG